MTALSARIDQAIVTLERDDPGLLTLAESLSLAVRIEPELLRAARIAALPSLDVGKEADLWFSALVQWRGIDGIGFAVPAIHRLRCRLASVPKRLHAAWGLIDREHRDISPALRLEEEIGWLALSDPDGFQNAVQKRIDPALHALVAERRDGLARWVVQALPRLPETLIDTIPLWLLRLAAGRLIRHQILLTGNPPPGLFDRDLSWLVHDLPSADIGGRFEGDVLILGADRTDSAWWSIPVPQTFPMLAELIWRDRGEDVSRLVQLTPRKELRIPVGHGPVQLRTARDQRFDLPRTRPVRQTGAAEADRRYGPRALFIGIGGTADEILARLKNQVISSIGKIPDSLQFRLIDTERDDYRKGKGARLGGENSPIAISGNEYLQLQDDPPGTFADYTRKVARDRAAFPEIARWYRADLFRQSLPEADFNLIRGAGQNRQFARMGVFINKQRLVGMLHYAIKQCGGGDGELPIWIIGSVAGGTGAGLYMDLALLVRLIANEQRQRFRVIGAAVLPDVYKDIGIDGARANAVIREFERFQSPVPSEYWGRLSGFQDDIRFTVKYDSTTQVNLNEMLFDNLVFYNRVCRSDDERRAYFSEVADGLSLLLNETAGDELFRESINAKEGAVTSFNSQRIFLPIRLYERQFILDAALVIANGLLPRDPVTQIVLAGTEDACLRDAERTLDEDLFPLFRILNMPTNEKPLNDLSPRWVASFIVYEMLGFANPAGVFGRLIGEDKERAARRLCDNIFQDIKTVRDIKEDFDDSKIRVQAEVALRRRDYEGRGIGSFSAALQAIHPLVTEQICASIDASAHKYLARLRASELALGRTDRVYQGVRELFDKMRGNLEQVFGRNQHALDSAKDREKGAQAALQSLEKRLLGWRGQLADREEQYLDAANIVNQMQQRERLAEFIRELIQVAEQHMTRWLMGMQRWREAILQVINEANDAGSEIALRLDRQTKVKSASMGLKNTVDMDGYREFLREKCLRENQTGKSFVDDLLHTLTWKPGQKPEDLTLDGWPDRGPLEVRDFSKILMQYLSTRISQRMRQFEGMSNYLRWLRDDKRDHVLALADKLGRVTNHFLDERRTSATRRFLFLHGDVWNREQHGENLFDAVYDGLAGDPNIGRWIIHNLTGAEGVNLFNDRNVLAILMVDNAIPYQQIRVFREMSDRYLAVRNEDNPGWRAETYHLFRCDQEAWRIEHEQVVATHETNFPQVPGHLSRLLDDPERVELFAKALVAGIIRTQSLAQGGQVWVCGSATEQDPRQLIYLNDPGDESDPRDLLRALVTFVMDRNDRRRHIRGTLDTRKVQGWIGEQLAAQGRRLEEMADAFREASPAMFQVQLEDTANGPTIGKDCFIALILNYYLKPLLDAR